MSICGGNFLKKYTVAHASAKMLAGNMPTNVFLAKITTAPQRQPMAAAVTPITKSCIFLFFDQREKYGAGITVNK